VAETREADFVEANSGEETTVVSTVRRVGAAGLALGLCLGAVNGLPASADEKTQAPAPAVGGLLGAVDGGLLDGLVGALLHGEGGVLGHEGGVLAGDDQLDDVVDGLAASDDGLLGGSLEVVGPVEDVLGAPEIGGNDSFEAPSVGGGLLGGVLGGLLGGGTGLLGGVF
jgi:hypothetical protein